MPKVIAEDSNDDIARNLWRTARLIRPSHPARKRWDLLMFLFVIYNAIYLPVQLAFGIPYFARGESNAHALAGARPSLGCGSSRSTVAVATPLAKLRAAPIGAAPSSAGKAFGWAGGCQCP